MNTTTRPGVLAVMDEASVTAGCILPHKREAFAQQMREARATVERLAADVSEVSAEMRARKVNNGRESPTLIAWADRIDAALAALRGEA